MRRVLEGLASAVVAALVVTALAVTVVPMLVGGRTLTVLSGSMVPALPVGSVAVDRPADAASLRVGDIVTYTTQDELSGAPIDVTHRIVAINQTSSGPEFTMKGDANNVADDRSVSASAVVGKVWFHVPYIGWARNVLLDPAGKMVLVGLALVLVAAAVLIGQLRRRAGDPDRRPDPRVG